MDNCWDYNEGESEKRMGKALKDGYREKVFLMTKFDGRTKKAAAQQIDESLRRLQVDHVDLIQFHEIIRMEDPDRIFSEDGAVHAALEARKAGKVRFIGFTGHKDPDIHLKMLETGRAHGFRFDTVQMPLNVMDAHFRSFERKVLPRPCKGRNRRPRHEVDGGRYHPEEQDGQAGGMSPLCDEPAGFHSDYRD